MDFAELETMFNLNFIFTIVLLFPFIGRADILFIDFNWSTKEIIAAEEAASLRNEKVIVLPSLPEGVRENLRSYWNKVLPGRNKTDNLKKKVSKLTELLNANIDDKWSEKKKTKMQNQISLLKKAIADHTEKEYSLNQEYEQLRSKYVRYGRFPREFELALIDLNRSGVQISTLIISGHHTHVYFGEAGELSTEDIARHLKLYPEMIAGLQTIYAWDCYSATINEVYDWRKVFPEIDVVGFFGRAPTQLYSGEVRFLKSMLINEERTRLAAQSQDKSEIENVFKEIYGFDVKNRLLGAASFGPYYHTAKNGTSILSDAEICDANDVAILRQQKKQFDQYLAANTIHAKDVPTNTSHSSLRDFYSQLRKMQHCKQVADLNDLGEKTINLIFFKTIQNNFGLEYGKELNRLQQIFEHLLIPTEFPNFSSSLSPTRAEILEFSQVLSGLINNHKINGLNLNQDGIFVFSMERLVRRILVELDCIPSTWIEAHTSKDNLAVPNEACIQN